MTSGIPFFALEKSYIDLTKDRLSRPVIADHLSSISGIPRSEKGVKDYLRHQRQEPAFTQS